jgi:hypothetical protein
MAFGLISRSLPIISRTAIRSCIIQTRFYSTPNKKTLPSLSMEGKVNNIRFITEISFINIGPLGQVCMVTGAARGLGNEFCRAFIQSYD